MDRKSKTLLGKFETTKSQKFTVSRSSCVPVDLGIITTQNKLPSCTWSIINVLGIASES